MKTPFLLALVLGVVVMMGAGCIRSANAPLTPQAQEDIRSVRTGDTIVLQEASAVVHGTYKGEAVTRRVQLTEFSMGKQSAGSWQLNTIATTSTELGKGTWSNATLNTSHQFYLPAIIDAKTRPLGDAAILFFGREEYREFANTLGTTIDLRVIEEDAWVTRTNAHAPAKKAFTALKSLARKEDDARKDLAYAKKEAEPVSVKVMVDGIEQRLPATRLRNWYGTYDVWNREDSPLVLSFTLDPQIDKTKLDVTKGDGAELAKLMNYRVTAIELAQ